MQLDTHKTMPAENFGPSPDLLPANFQPPPDYLSMLKTSRAATKGRRAASAGRTRPTDAEAPLEYSSVFRPRPGQEHVCGLTTMHRSKVASSEWALLDTLEVQMINEDKDRRAKLAAERAARTRAQLDHQMAEKELQARAEAAELRREAELLASEVAATKADEAARAEAQRLKNLKAKAERMTQVRAVMLSAASFSSVVWHLLVTAVTYPLLPFMSAAPDH